MDLLQVALIFLILLLSIFLGITGVQVFLILKDLKKALDKLNKVLNTTDEIAQEVEKPVVAAANLVNTLSNGAKVLSGMTKREDDRPRQKRFYKRTL